MSSLDWVVWTVILVVGSALATAVLVHLLQPVLRQYALARPNARSSHREPTPQGGGGPIVIVMIATSVAAFTAVGAPLVTPCIVFAVAIVLAIVGAIDDIRVLAPFPRLVIQVAAATTVVATLPDELRVLDLLPLIVERFILVLGVVWFVNLVNFMDGIDWITVVEVVPVSGGLAILGATGHAPLEVSIVAVALGGATLGFAPFNRPVARLFLGDVGSLPIGLVLAWLLILTAAHGQLTAAVLLPLYYLADATITLGRRVARRERIWQAHRTHFYQRATTHGFSIMAVVTRVFAVNVVLVGLAIIAAFQGTTGSNAACLLAGVGVVACLLRVLARVRK